MIYRRYNDTLFIYTQYTDYMTSLCNWGKGDGEIGSGDSIWNRRDRKRKCMIFILDYADLPSWLSFKHCDPIQINRTIRVCQHFKWFSVWFSIIIICAVFGTARQICKRRNINDICLCLKPSMWMDDDWCVESADKSMQFWSRVSEYMYHFCNKSLLGVVFFVLGLFV